MDCLFCKIASKEIPSYSIYEDSETLGFLDIHPLAAGHTVIIPKIHAARITTLPESLASALGLTIKRVSDILHKSLQPDGLTIGVNDGPGAGQGVGHLHVHIIPRWMNDGGGNLHTIIKGAPTMSLDQVISKIAHATKKLNN